MISLKIHDSKTYSKIWKFYLVMTSSNFRSIKCFEKSLNQIFQKRPGPSRTSKSPRKGITGRLNTLHFALIRINIRITETTDIKKFHFC